MASQAESFCRDRRLFDVRRGVVYLRRTDDLAQRQWRHYGTVPVIKTHVIRDVGVTTRLSEASGSPRDMSPDQSLELKVSEEGEPGNEVRRSVSVTAGQQKDLPASKSVKYSHKTTVLEDFGSSVQPKILLTENTDTMSTVTAVRERAPRPSPLSFNSNVAGDVQSEPVEPTAAPALSTPKGVVNTSWADPELPVSVSGTGAAAQACPQPASTSKHDQRSSRESLELSPEGQSGAGVHFDMWGSRDWAVDSKLDPLPERRTHAPKHYPPMSRAAGGKPGKAGGRPRQLKTLTDFRSKNGTVRVIRPLPPVADTKGKSRVWGGQPDDDDLDLATLDREQTYAMLKRIDRLLEPTRAYFSSDLTSSQREVCSSTSPSISPLTSSLQGDDPDDRAVQHVQDDRVHIHDHSFHRYFGEDTERIQQLPPKLTDKEHEYIGRIQRRLDQFYGHHGEKPHCSPEGRDSLSKRPKHQPGGRSETVGRHLDPVHPSRPVQRHNRFSEHNTHTGRSQQLDCPLVKHTRPGAASHQAKSYIQYNQAHGNGAKGRGRQARGKQWASLSEVVAQLEKKGVDLHFKCQDWIGTNFS